jgi:hypothetical protein
MLDTGRRQFISLVGGAAIWPFAARARSSDTFAIPGEMIHEN